MTVCLKDEFNQLVDLLARQANMERWCYCLLSTLNRDLKFCNITLMIEQDNETKVIASWEKEGDFKHYSTPLSFADYNGVPLVCMSRQNTIKSLSGLMSISLIKRYGTRTMGTGVS